MTHTVERPLLELIEGKEFEAKQDQIARSKLLSLTETALDAVGIGRDTVPGRIMRLVVRVAGLDVFTDRSRTDIASDPDVQCEESSVPGALRRLHDSGLIRRGTSNRPGGRRVIALQAVYSEIVRASNRGTESRFSEAVEWSAPRGAPRGNDVASHVVTTWEPRGNHVARHVVNEADTIYPFLPIPSPSPSEEKSAEDDGEVSVGSVSVEVHVEAAIELRDVVTKRSPKRADEAREDLWQIAFVALFIEGRSQIDRWIRAAKRKQPYDWPDYFFACARQLCEERGVRMHDLRARCPPCPAKSERSSSQPPASIDAGLLRNRIYLRLRDELGRVPTDEEIQNEMKVLT